MWFVDWKLDHFNRSWKFYPLGYHDITITSIFSQDAAKKLHHTLKNALFLNQQPTTNNPTNLPSTPPLQLQMDQSFPTNFASVLEAFVKRVGNLHPSTASKQQSRPQNPHLSRPREVFCVTFVEDLLKKFNPWFSPDFHEIQEYTSKKPKSPILAVPTCKMATLQSSVAQFCTCCWAGFASKDFDGQKSMEPLDWYCLFGEKKS